MEILWKSFRNPFEMAQACCARFFFFLWVCDLLIRKLLRFGSPLAALISKGFLKDFYYKG